MLLISEVQNVEASVCISVDTIGKYNDTLKISQFSLFSGYLGIGWPLGVGGEFSYRPSSVIGLTIGGNVPLPILFEFRSTISTGVSFAMEKIKSEGRQVGISASVIIFPPGIWDQTLYTVSFCLGTMPGSLPRFNWKFGCLIFLSEGKDFHKIHGGLPIVSVSWRIF